MTFCFTYWVGVGTVCHRLHTNCSFLEQPPSWWVEEQISPCLGQSQRGKSGCTDSLGATSEFTLKPQEAKWIKHLAPSDRKGSHRPNPISACEIPRPNVSSRSCSTERPLWEQEKKSLIASVQFVLSNHVIALELTTIIYVPLYEVLNLDRPTAFLYGCQEKKPTLQAVVLGWGWWWWDVTCFFPLDKELSLVWANSQNQSFTPWHIIVCLVHTQLKNIQKPFQKHFLVVWGLFHLSASHY